MFNVDNLLGVLGYDTGTNTSTAVCDNYITVFLPGVQGDDPSDSLTMCRQRLRVPQSLAPAGQ